MKKIRYSLVCLLVWLSLCPSQAQVSFGHAEKWDDGWRFLRIDTAWNIREIPSMREPDFDDSRWRTVPLPHDWSIEQPMSPDKGSCQGYLPGGIGWYRKHFTATKAPKQYVYFEGVYNHSEVYLNGHLLGQRPSGFSSFLYDMTPYLRKDSDNVLAVRANHSQEADSRWYTGSGIYRHVWLITAPEVHLAQWGTAYRLRHIDNQKAEIEVDVQTTDERQHHTPVQLKAIIELMDAGGHIVTRATTTIGAHEKKKVKLVLNHPQRWTLEQPYLYDLVTKIVHPQYADSSKVRVGLRTLEFSPTRGFSLNEQWMKIKGVCLHDDAGVLGTAVPRKVWQRRLIELKEIGVNAIRMSHNPHAPELYDLCDELGLLVMDEASDEWEFPKRKWMKGWNQGQPGYQGTYTYFEEWIERDVADMVRRDRCHPSVFLWSIGNEVDYPNDPYSHPVLDGDGTGFTQPMYGGYKPEQPHAERIGLIAQRLARIVKDIDTTRPTTGALAGVVMSNETAYPSAVDVVGYNYTESRYNTDHQRYPERIIYGSENRHDYAAWHAVTDNAHIFGQFLWTGIDYLGESGVWPARGSSAGLLDLAGQRKPLGWYRAALWSAAPTCYIGTYLLGPQRGGSRQNNQRTFNVSPYATDTWNYEEGQHVRVFCYTNATTARLILNGHPIGGTPQRDENSGILYWDIVYQPGTLTCETDNETSYTIRTTGAPTALRITTDSTAHIFIEVIDENGYLVKQADSEITLRVSGARLLGMENGDIMQPTSPRQFSSNASQRFSAMRCRTSSGRLTAYIQPTERQKEITIRATSSYLKAAELVFPPQH